MFTLLKNPFLLLKARFGLNFEISCFSILQRVKPCFKLKISCLWKNQYGKTRDLKIKPESRNEMNFLVNLNSFQTFILNNFEHLCKLSVSYTLND